jgi:hypothetical protein
MIKNSKINVIDQSDENDQVEMILEEAIQTDSEPTPLRGKSSSMTPIKTFQTQSIHSNLPKRRSIILKGSKKSISTE